MVSEGRCAREAKPLANAELAPAPEPLRPSSGFGAKIEAL
jgi:hypothetical protein